MANTMIMMAMLMLVADEKVVEMKVIMMRRSPKPKDKSQVQLVMVGHRWAMVGQYNIGGLCSIVCWAQNTISKTARTLTDPIPGLLTLKWAIDYGTVLGAMWPPI